MNFYTSSVFTVSFLLCFASHAVGQQIGFIKIAADEEHNLPEVGVWYNSADTAEKHRFGPFDVEYAFNGQITGQNMPIILFSHGWSGRYKNHHLTAAALAKAGYIVAGVQHRFDRWIGIDESGYESLLQRIQEINSTLQILKKHPLIKPMADFNNIGILGYSLGGGTVLAAAGVQPDINVAAQHCAQNSKLDFQFCQDMPWSFVPWQWITEPDWSKLKNTPTTNLQFKSMVLIAPVAQLFTQTDLQQLNSPPTAIFRVGEDAELKFPYHAEYLMQNLGNVHAYQVFAGVHHYAFIAPFAERVPNRQSIPVASDPAGFDRPLFLKQINQQIVEHFKSTMPAH